MLEPLRVALPLGIGDVHWAATKFRALSAYHGGRPLHAYINKSRNHATIGYVEILPQVEKCFLSDQAPFTLQRDMLPNHRVGKWSKLDGCKGWRGFDYLLVPNGHLERGLPLATWLPELGPDATEYTYDLKVSAEDREYVAGLCEHQPRVLLYLSGMGPNADFHNNIWSIQDWVTTVALLNAEGIEPVIVGANTDDDLGYFNWFETQAKNVKYLNAVGKTSIPQYCAIIQSARCWVGLNSGGGIVSGMLKTPTVMLWSDHKYPIFGATLDPLHHNMQTSWLNEEQLRTYRTFSYGSPELTVQAVVKTALEIMR